jgi:hypothetical protein
MKRVKSVKSIIALLVIVATIMFYFVSVINSSINFPIYDDYEAILLFLVNFEKANTVFSKCGVIFKQHNEHRIIFGKMVALGYHAIFGLINFVHLIIIGNAALIGILVVLYKSFKIESIAKRLIILIPITIFLFNFKYTEVSCWAMASLQNIWVLLFAFVSFYFLFNDKKQSVVWAIVFATIATFTSGNGLLVFFTGIIVLLLKQEKRKTIIVFSIALILNAIVYFVGLQKIGKHPSLMASFIAHPLDLFLYPMNFIGVLFFEHTTTVGIIIGALVLLGITFIFYKKLYQANYLLFSFLVFMVLTVVVVTLSRFGFGVIQASASRYMINATLIYIIIGMILMERFQSKLNYKIFIPSLLLTIIFNSSGYAVIQHQKEIVNSALRNIDLVNKGNVAEYTLFYPGNDELPQSILSQANSVDIFKTKKTDFTALLSKIKFNIDTSNTRYAIDQFQKISDTTFVVTGWVLIANKNSYNTTILLSLEDSLSHSFIELTQNKLRNDVTTIFKNENCNYDYCGFTKEINLLKYPKGELVVSLLMMSDGINLKIPIHKKIKI